MSRNYRTTEEIERSFGAQVKALRLDQDVDQITLAERAAVSVSALKALESGRGSSLRTVVRVARALDRVDWLDTFYEQPTVSPLALAREREGVRRPQRASPRSKRPSR
jgi:transcriptional regulator with XRE-family HTH domain